MSRIKLSINSLLTLSLTVSMLLLSTNLAFAQRGGPARVGVSRVKQLGEGADQEFIGSTLPTRRAVIGSAVEGRIVEVNIEEGQFVEYLIPSARENNPTESNESASGSDNTEAGQEASAQQTVNPMGKTSPMKVPYKQRTPLVEVRTETLQIQIDSAVASVNLAKQELQQLELSLPFEIQQAEAEQKAARESEKLALANLNRLTRLSSNDAGVVSPDVVDQAASEFAAAEAARSVAETQVQLLQETKESRLGQARARLNVQEENLASLMDQLEKYTIRAPFSGHITVKSVEVGDWISRGDPVAELVQLDPIEVRVNVPESYIGRLFEELKAASDANKRLTATISFEGLPGQQFAGEVMRIVPQADLRTRSLPVVIYVRNPAVGDDRLIQSGMLARATLPVGIKKPGLYVPKDAVVLNGILATVVVVDEKGGQQFARPVPVQLGESINELIEVRGEIEEGQIVVTEGNERLRPGQPVLVSKQDDDE